MFSSCPHRGRGEVRVVNHPNFTFVKYEVSSHKASIITYIMKYIFVYDILLLGYDRL